MKTIVMLVLAMGFVGSSASAAGCSGKAKESTDFQDLIGSVVRTVYLNVPDQDSEIIAELQADVPNELGHISVQSKIKYTRRFYAEIKIAELAHRAADGSTFVIQDEASANRLRDLIKQSLCGTTVQASVYNLLDGSKSLGGTDMAKVMENSEKGRPFFKYDNDIRVPVVINSVTVPYYANDGTINALTCTPNGNLKVTCD